MRYRDSGPGLVGSLITIVVCLLVMWGIYACSSSSCQERGGHIEVIYGGKGGWVCDGATR